MASPPDQTLRPIAFYLEGGGADPVKFHFAVRPSDLSHPEPSRMTVTQTLGGAFVDCWGRGLSEITLSGNNGWRGSNDLSGEALFQKLRSTVFTGWHQRRATAIAAGQTPNVTLTFTDALDSIRVTVAPKSFQLRRSKSNPLIMDYSIQLTVLGDATQNTPDADPISGALADPQRWSLAVAGLSFDGLQIALSIPLAAAGLLNGVASDVAAVVGFANSAVSVFNQVVAVGQQLKGQFDALTGPLLATAVAIARGGSNGWAALVNLAAPIPALTAMLGMGGLFGDAWCTMLNGFNIGRYFASYDDLFGASWCSSTGGGDPISAFALAGTNPFDTMYPAGAAALSVSAAAAAGLLYLQGDPLTFTAAETLSAMAAVGAGVVLA